MERSEVEQWIAQVVDTLRPALLAQARMMDRLDIEAPPPEETAERIAAIVLARLAAGDKSG